MFKFKNAILLFAAFIISFVIMEAGTRYFVGHPLEIIHASQRVMLFEKGDNFKNVEDIFKYHANKSIHSTTYYVIDNLPIKEYSYEIHTNNLGLVQQRDINTSQHVEIILGDSFTEGQGAIPWFYEFDNFAVKQNRNFVNGGILGTGPLQWERLKQTLDDEGLKFKSVNVVLLGADTGRPIWNFTKNQLQCLQTAECTENVSDFWGYDFQRENEAENVLKIHKGATRVEFAMGRTKSNVKKIIKHSAFLYVAYMAIKTRMLKDDSNDKRPQEQDIENKEAHPLFYRNAEAIKRLVHSGESTGFVVLVNTKEEAGQTPRWDKSSLMFINYAEQNNIPYSTCALNSEDFHTYDGHPNEKGYAKLRECVTRAAELQRGKQG